MSEELKQVTHIDNVRLGEDEKSVVIIDQTQLPNRAQCYPHSAARSAIFEGIIQQILEEAGEQGLIRLSCDMLWNVQDQGLLPLPLLTAQGPRQAHGQSAETAYPSQGYAGPGRHATLCSDDHPGVRRSSGGYENPRLSSVGTYGPAAPIEYAGICNRAYGIPLSKNCG